MTTNDVIDNFCLWSDCGKPVGEEDMFCSDECTDLEYEAVMKRRNRACVSCGKKGRSVPFAVGRDKCILCVSKENSCSEHGFSWCPACK